MMAMIMQAMQGMMPGSMQGMMAGQMPGQVGSMAGGTTDRSNLASRGDASNQTPGMRWQQRFAGRQPESLPVEFRDALEGYFKQMEKAENATEM
jgi:hypothetical protein